MDPLSALRQEREEQEESELQKALALSASCEPPPEPGFLDIEDDIQQAIRASEAQAEAEAARKRELMKQEDSSELFQAALRASRVDLGPRGVSQAAKVMATGDESLGQAGLLARTG